MNKYKNELDMKKNILETKKSGEYNLKEKNSFKETRMKKKKKKLSQDSKQEKQLLP